MPTTKQDTKAREQMRGCLPDEARDHLRTARKEMRQSMESLLPPDFVAHRRAARREVLLAAQNLIQHALDRLEV